jgi:hypothetical protein
MTPFLFPGRKRLTCSAPAAWQLVIKLITNAGSTRMVSDDILRLFLDWIDQYHEVHFAMVRVEYEQRNDPPTRYDIYSAIYGEQRMPRDDSAEADLFRLVISDLSIGRVIRQPRETDWQGRFKRRPRGRRTTNHHRNARICI